jgi:hypothetical protein
MLIANEALWFGAFVVLVLGVLVSLARSRAGVAKQMRNMPVKVVTYRNGKCYKFAFSTIGDAEKVRALPTSRQTEKPSGTR